MRRFTFIDHTGDAGVRVFGEDLPMLFRHAAEAFSQILTDPRSIKERISENIILKASDLEGLLVAWLNELLFLFETKGLLFRHFDIHVLSAVKLDGTAKGEVYEEGRHPIKTLIKAVTYHQLRVHREKGLWTADIIFDL